MMDEGPRYWMYETSGVLCRAVEAYLYDLPMTDQHIVVLRAYLCQWIMAPSWDRNPHADDDRRTWLASMRAAVDGLTSRAEIETWIGAATNAGMDPL